MIVLWVFFALAIITSGVALEIFRKKHNKAVDDKCQEASDSDDVKMTTARIEKYRAANVFPVPEFVSKMLYALSVIVLLAGSWNSVMFYAEPGYTYYIKNIAGQESVATEVGWHAHVFGEYVAWKRGATIQARNKSEEDDNATKATSNQGPIGITFLDQVDAKTSAMARFTLPTDEETFLELVHEFRNFDNLVNNVFVTSFQETLNATASLMTAEEYFSGGRTTFASEFETQMKVGIYMVKRDEVQVSLAEGPSEGSANASKGGNQDQYGDNTKTIYVVTKLMDEAGQYRIKRQSFLQYGITVSAARITNMDPNVKFRERMQLKQQASADRAIAREKRVQEEEQRLLAIASGDRKVAEKQAEAKVDQILKTTNAETVKQEAETKAAQQLAVAELEKQTAQVAYEQTLIDAKATIAEADAAAHARKVKIESDNGLKMKLNALVQMNADNANAFAIRKVPGTVVYSGTGGANGLGSDGDIATLATTQMLKNLKALDVDVSVKD